MSECTSDSKEVIDVFIQDLCRGSLWQVKKSSCLWHGSIDLSTLSCYFIAVLLKMNISIKLYDPDLSLGTTI